MRKTEHVCMCGGVRRVKQAVVRVKLERQGSSDTRRNCEKRLQGQPELAVQGRVESSSWLDLGQT